MHLSERSVLRSKKTAAKAGARCGSLYKRGDKSLLFAFKNGIDSVARIPLINFERNSVHGKMHFVDAAVGQSSQQHGLGRKIEQPCIICNCFKIG